MRNRQGSPGGVSPWRAGLGLRFASSASAVDSGPTLRDRMAKAVRQGSRSLAGVRYRLDPGDGTVALTFDDGPDPQFTPRILDALAEMDVSATFFLVGDQASKCPGLVQRIASSGHAVGTHGASHPEPRHLRFADLHRDYLLGRRIVEEILGTSVSLFRPPKGHIGPVGTAAIRANRLRAWLWTVDPGDWRFGIQVDDLVAATAALVPGDIVLLHDGLCQPRRPETTDRSVTVEALPAIITHGHSRGLRFATLPTVD